MFRKGCIILTLLIATFFNGRGQLAANFSGSPLSGCVPLVVNFTDQSTGNPTQWRWDLGNGTISFIQNPSGTYFIPGTYNVKLVIQNAAGTKDSIIKNQYINVYALPTVDFSATPTTGCFPLPVQFTDATIPGSGVISSWLWDFGDGNTGNTQNPSHVYTAGGNYNVTLQVLNSFGCIKTLTKTNYIQINTGVVAGFSNTQPTNCSPPNTINFTNTTTGSGTISYQWNFGDGGTSTLPNPSHVYTSTGSFTVTLIATSTTGCTDTLIKPDAVIIQSVDASFTNANTVCLGQPLTFNNTSTPSVGVPLWDFGDGTTSIDVNPVKTYATSGNYTVKLITTVGSCIDSAFTTITVLPKPLISFAASATSACIAPFNVSFNNNTTGGSSYQWYFGDGGTSVLQNPTHTYNSYGAFTVKLVVTSAGGCKDSLELTDYIIIQPLQATISNLPSQGCAPFSQTFGAVLNTPDPVTSYFWDFGDGNTSNLPNPTHVYNAGTYDIRLIVTTASGCTDTVNVNGGVMVGIKPTPNFGAIPRTACSKTPIEFTDSSFANITQWYWQFGDGGTSIEQNPIHKYSDTGFFTVTLTVWNNGCPDTIQFTDYIYIYPPVAIFNTSFTCANPRTITFTDASIGANEWQWDFGDGNTSNVQNPVHTFADSGTYIIRLRVVNYQTGCDDTSFYTLRILKEPANFSATDTVICRHTSTTFNAFGSSPGTIVNWSWNFGDGNTGSGESVSHTYPNPGLYTIKLVITDISGCKDSLTKTNYIRVDGPTAAFTIPNGGACLNVPYTFNDQSFSDGINPITMWVWNFGDGTIDTFSAPPFTHTYTGAALYTVLLKVIDSQGCFDISGSSTSIIISDPFAGFLSPDTITCPNGPIRFNSTSVGSNLSYFWDFGDGNTGTGADPVHNYLTDGIYTVKLFVTDQYGCTDSIIKPDYIRITTPQASFTISDSLSTCPPLIIQFNNTSINAAINQWDFGDGSSSTATNPLHIYNNPGTYVIKLIIKGPGGVCSDSAFHTITVRGPSGTFSYTPLNGCKPHTISISATTLDRISFIWDFNDGNTISTTDSVLTHTYTIPGLYVPKMILLDAGGCQVPVQGNDTVFVRGVNALFGLTANPLCDSGIIQFTDSSFSNDGFASYNWTFGDGGTSTLQNPSHYYTTPGQYFPELIITTNSGCRDTATLPLPIKIVASPQISIVNSPEGCAPVTVSFNGLLNVPDTSAINWKWDFGNGNTSVLQNPPPQTYTLPQVYNIRLIATNSTGCKDTSDKTVEAYLVPVVTASPDVQICRGGSTTITANGAVTYSWSPTAGLSCNNCFNPSATPDSSRRYLVTGTSSQGCSNTDSVDVTVIQAFDMISGAGDTICLGASSRLFASGANTYLWSPANGLNSVTSPAPLASPTVTTTYRVVGYDAYGCFTDTAFTTINVYPIPTVNAGNDVTIKNGQQINLTPVFSPDVNSVLWIPSPGIISYNLPSITVKPKETTEYTVEVKNNGGCKSSDKVTVFVICDGTNVFIPNTFSPNSDGVNDQFYPRGSGLFSVKHLRIFNRWGEIVFEKNNFLPNDAGTGWDGTYKGKALTSDVFVYTAEIICENSSIIVLKGNLSLLR